MSLNDVQAAAEHGLTVRCVALSILLYDYFLTLADEIELFWAKPWTLATSMFLWSRYCGLLVILCPKWFYFRQRVCAYMTCSAISLFILFQTFLLKPRCQEWLLFETLLGTLNTWAVQFILQLRLYALYGSSQRIARLCGVIFCSQVLLMTVLVIRGLYILIVTKPAFCAIVHGMTFCAVRDPSTYSWCYWTLVASFEATVIILTLRRVYQYYYQRGSPVLTSITPTLLRDSVTYSLLIGFVYLLNIVLSFTSDSNLDIGGVVGFTLPGLMNGRMMLNVRRVFEKHRQCPSSPSQVTFVDGITTQIEDMEESIEPVVFSFKYL